MLAGEEIRVMRKRIESGTHNHTGRIKVRVRSGNRGAITPKVVKKLAQTQRLTNPITKFKDK